MTKTISIVAFFKVISSSGYVFFLLNFQDLQCVIQGLRLIYTGDSSVLTGHRAASKPSKAEKYSMREVTPESVAYIATQVGIFPPLYFILSSLLCRYILACAALNHGAQRMATSASNVFIMFA